jgi:hypothetical protein
MPSEMFYIVLGGLVVTSLGIGFSMTSNVYSPPEIMAAGSYSILGGTVLLLIVIGAAFFDIKSRVEDWHIENRYDNLGKKRRKIELKEREAEIRQKEKEFREQEKQNSKPKTTEIIPDKITMDEITVDETIPDKITSDGIFPDKITLDKITIDETIPDKITSQPETKDKPILETGHAVDPKLQNYEPIQESEITDKQYGNLITEDISLKIMWTLLKIPGHTFDNRNKLRLHIEKEDIKKTTYGDIFDELVKLNLINKVGKEDYANKKQSKWVVELSDLGIRLITVARKEKITTWGKFSERFKNELAT